MKIAIGSDHRGVDGRKTLRDVLEGLQQDVLDEGTFESGAVDYPDIARQVGEDVSSGRADRGVLICGTGIGMAVAANKVHGVRAATIDSERLAAISRQHNDLNVLCLPETLTDPAAIRAILKTWLATDFEGGRHQRRIEKIRAIENR